MMHMEHRLSQNLSQRLMLTQKMQQAIQILQLSGIELEQYLQKELEQNPVLEQLVKEPKPETVQPAAPATADGAPIEDTAFNLDDYATQWTDFRREGTDFSRNPDLAERRDYYQNSITKEESFSAKLLTQLRLAAQDAKTLEIGELIIGEIDNRGYFTGSLDDLAKEAGTTVEDAERVLHMVQRFEPTGVGARDVIECLLLQIDLEYPHEPELKVLVAEHLEALEHRQIPKIAKEMRISVERVEELKELLSKLNPWPGHEYSAEPTQYVTPDVIVEKIDEEIVVYLSDDSLPALRINEDYRKMMGNGRVTREEKAYLRDKVESAKWLIRNVEQRQQTILRIARAIVEVQEEFLERGIEFIKPLTLQEIADKVGVHEATVSRTTRGKYMQTPQGLFEMKFFFSPGLKRDSGENQSSKSVQSIIKKMIDEEDKAKPMSDQKIADMLKKQGLNIARRTVTKYREALGILPTSMRRSYQEA
ncbi:MAG: RNA polymerase factor sigma-54 [Candidatus Hydrogenedentes bacterium]|nr:RNA polymerase factor sigma-54 [Candidatus Hydrogenedentota bacterium]